ncbi:M28 family peptidase [Planctomycetota bacterium]
MNTRNRSLEHISIALFLIISTFSSILTARTKIHDLDRLVAQLLGDTPLVEDLRQLTDEIGGRPQGTEANRRSVIWALDRFKNAGVDAHAEAFTVPKLWLERSATARVHGDVSFSLRIASMPFSIPTPNGELVAPLLDGGTGSEEDFERLGDLAHNALILVETPLLVDFEGLFKQFTVAADIQRRVENVGVAGIVYVSSRPPGRLYRQNAPLGKDNKLPMLIVERDAGMRLLRLLRSGHKLELSVVLDIEVGGPFESHNVIAEIQGRECPEEIVVIGAHLDSWGLGQGALDNGCNVAMLIDIARQIRRLDIRPRRTIRFCLFNGEEVGFLGSWGYTTTHAKELDRHVLAQSYDVGSGRITGFFTNGRPELERAVEQSLKPVQGLGPFEHNANPIAGTDNYDFMLQGVANIVAIQEMVNYTTNYHAESDTFDKVDQRQLRLNAAIAAAVTWSFAEMSLDLKRQTRSQVQTIIDTTDLGDRMRSSWRMEAWEKGERGLPK